AVGARDEGQPSGRRQGQRAAGGGQRHLDGGGTRVHVGDRQPVAVRRGEDQGGVLVDRLGGRGQVHRGVVDRGDGDGDGVGVGQRAAGAGVAQVVSADRQRRRAAVVGGRGVAQAGQDGVD